MALVRWQATVQDDNGNAVVNPSITVRNAATNALASIYDDAGLAKSNPFIGGADGFVSFKANPGRYIVEGASGAQVAEDWTVDLVAFDGFASYKSRSAAVVAANIAGWSAGAVISDGAVHYKYSGTGSAIPDMPGWVPYGDITARHFGNVVSSESLNMAAGYVRSIGGGTIVTRDEWGQATITATVDITGVDLRGGKFKHASGDQHMFTASGSIGSLGTLTASASRGDATINLSSTVGVVAGTFLLITSTDAYATTDAGYKSGEVVEVASVSGSVVTLVSPVQGRIDRSAYNVGDLVRVVNYAKGPFISDITIEGDWEAKGLIIFASYVDKPEVHRVYVKDHGNAAIRYHNTKNGKLSGGRIQNLRMDLPNGRSAYAMMLSGSDVGFEMDGVVTDKVRHAFTAIGGSGGFARKFTVKNCIDFNSLSGSFDTHAAGADYEISNCSSFDSAGNAFQCRAPYGTYHGNTAVRPKSHGFLLAENVLADVTISAFTLRDGSNIGISCAVNCNNLRILDCVLDGMGTYGIRLFNSATVASSGAVISRNVIRNWGSVTSGLSGIQIDGTQANTSILIDGNYFNAGVAGIARAIRILSATGCTVRDNTADGSYSSNIFDVGSSNRLLNNVTIGTLADAVGAAATDAATTMALANSIRSALIAAGIVRQ